MNKIFFISIFFLACHSSEEAQYPDEDYQAPQEESQPEESSSYKQSVPQEEETDSEPEPTPAPKEEEDPCMGCEWFPANSPLGCNRCKE